MSTLRSDVSMKTLQTPSLQTRAHPLLGEVRLKTILNGLVSFLNGGVPIYRDNMKS